MIDSDIGFLPTNQIRISEYKYNTFFSNKNKEYFKKINEKIQTNTQFFNRKSGLQIYTKNVTVEQITYRDNWYGGTFYNGVFEGTWYNGQWINGVWNGWNMLNTDDSTSAITSLYAPSTFVFGTVDKYYYVSDYELLKRKKLYYDIAPWDEANNKNTEVVNLPLRKKERRM